MDASMRPQGNNRLSRNFDFALITDPKGTTDPCRRQSGLVIVDKPLMPDAERDSQRQSSSEAGAGEVHDAVGDQAATLERGPE